MSLQQWEIQQWEIIIGVIVSTLLALVPWMFMVHAKLAVVSAQVARLDAKVDKMVDAEQQRLPWCIQHQATLEELSRRVESHETQLADIYQRLQEV
jgi:hypothetical protein